MASRCKTCNLPDDLRSSVDEMLLSGMPYLEISGWLETQGHPGFTKQQLSSHYLKHVEAGEARGKVLTATLDDSQVIYRPGDSSSETHKRTIRAMATLCDRLQSQSVAARNLRVDRLLSESLHRLHSMMAEVDYE